MTVGFKKFAVPKTYTKAEIDAIAAGVEQNEFVFFTGGKYAARKKSGRTKCLRTITEVKKPVALSVYVRRALEQGFNTEISLGGLGLHATKAKPAVYLRLEKMDDGAYRTVTKIDNPDPSYFKSIPPNGIAEDTVVIPAPDKAKGKGVAVVPAK